MAEKLDWLEEVKEDAKYNYMRQLKQQQEDKAHQEAKAQRVSAKSAPKVVEPENKKGK